ncbi:RNA-directed DNA polymerase from mobile element jockey [Trichonephila clavipes]|nr:RNA-directed DNA polymerase from mobile element jockey [Trichonephila clavipes]
MDSQDNYLRIIRCSDSRKKISAGFQRGRSTGAVFLDIQKAFDRVWISGLIYKLITNHFPPPLIHIINSYLVNRTFKIRVNDTLSLPHNVNIGLTQGTPTPLFNNSGTANRDVTHSVPSTNRIAPSPSRITRKTPKVAPQTIASSPTYSLPPHRLLQHSSQPIRKLRAPHPGLSTLSGHIHCSVMGRRNTPRSTFHVPKNFIQIIQPSLFALLSVVM